MFLPAIATSPSASSRPQRQKRFRSCLPGVVCLWFLVLLTGCAGRPTYPPELRLADSLADHYLPDSARVVLQQCSSRIAEMPEAVRMYHRLLEVKAADKAYVTHTSDSLIRDIVTYYEDRGDKRLLPEAYYYAGRVYRDLGDAPEALKYFQLAAKALKGSTDYRLMKVVYSQMGDVLLFQDVYEEALKVYKKSLFCQQKLQEARGTVFVLCSISNAFKGLNKPDSALHYLQQAEVVAQADGDKLLTNRVRITIADLYTQLEEYDKAKQALQQLWASDPNKTIALYFITADYYHQTGRLDSAKFYYHKLAQFKDMYAQRDASWGLGLIAQAHSDSRAALKYLQEYERWTDTIRKVERTETIRKMQASYNYQLREQENLLLRSANDTQQRHLHYAYFTIAIILLLSIILIQQNRKKALRIKVQEEKIKRITENSRWQEEQIITENKHKLKALEEELNNARKESNYVTQLLLAQKDEIVRKNNQIEENLKERAAAEKLLFQSDIYHKFHHAAKKNSPVSITDKDWQTLQISLDACYHDFTARLCHIHPISDVEQKICLLEKIGIGNNSIARLIGRSESAVISARKSLYKKFFGKEGTPSAWSSFIKSL